MYRNIRKDPELIEENLFIYNEKFSKTMEEKKIQWQDIDMTNRLFTIKLLVKLRAWSNFQNSIWLAQT